MSEAEEVTKAECERHITDIIDELESNGNIALVESLRDWVWLCHGIIL